MAFYKVKDGKLTKYNSGFVVYNNRIYTNPTKETLEKVGYKENIVYDEKPEFNDELQYLIEVYNEDDTTIHVSYDVVDIDISDGTE